MKVKGSAHPLLATPARGPFRQVHPLPLFEVAAGDERTLARPTGWDPHRFVYLRPV